MLSMHKDALFFVYLLFKALCIFMFFVFASADSDINEILLNHETLRAFYLLLNH